MSELLRMPRLFILLLMISAPMVGAVLFTPSLPDIAQDFNLTSAEVQWTTSLFLFGFSLGPLIYGPLGNRLGRKKTLAFGLLIALFGSLLAVFATSFEIFCLARFIQGLGASVGLKITFTMVGDLHRGHAATKVLSVLLIGPALGPGIAVAIGGFLTVAFGWKGCFTFLSLYNALLFFLSYTLPETAKELDSQALQFKKIATNYLVQLKDPSVMLHGILMGLSVSMIYVFANEAPHIAIGLMGISPDRYGLFNLSLPLGIVSGLFIGNRIAEKTTPRNAMLLGILLSLFGALVMGLCFFNGAYSGWTLFLPEALIQMGGFMLWLFASSHGLSESKDKSNASAVMQFINLGSATLATILSGVFDPKALFKIPFVMGLLSLLAFVIWIILKERHQKSQA